MHEIILETSEKLLRDHCTKEIIDQVEQNNPAHSLWQQVNNLGLTNISIPEFAGGVGGNYEDALQLIRLFGKFAAPVPFMETLLSKWLLTKNGYTDLGQEIYTLKITMESRLKIIDDTNEITVKGTLENVPWGRMSTYVLTLAEQDKQIYLVLLPINIAEINPNHNLAGEFSDTLIFDHVLKDNIWHMEIESKEKVQKWLDLGALAKSAQMVGSMERILELSLQYVDEREQFGRPLHRFQAIQHHLASLAGHVLAASTIVNSTIKLFNENRQSLTFEIAATKIRVSELVREITELAHQIHGAIGVTFEHRLHQYTRRLWVWRDEYGNESYWGRKLAQRIGKSEQGIWEFMTN